MNTADDEVREVVDRYWRGFLEAEPLYATQVGVHDWDDRLIDPGDAGRAQMESVNRDALRQLERFDRPQLDFERRAALDLMEATARRELDFLDHRLDRLWAVSHMIGGRWYGPMLLPNELASLHRVADERDADNYVARLAALPRYFAEVTTLVHGGARVGQTMPMAVIERVLGQVERFLAEPPDGNVTLKPLRSWPAAHERGVALLRDAVFPACIAYADAVRDYGAAARDTLGLCGLPGGADLYAAEIRGWTGLELAPQEIADLGKDQLKRIEERRAELAGRLGLGSAAAASQHLSEAPRQLQTRAAILESARNQVERAWARAPAFFGRLPTAPCEVEPVNPAIEDDILDHYRAPDGGGGRPGTYYVNTKPRPAYSLATTTFHEAVPGHHLQIALDQEADGRPGLRRFSAELQGLAFAEGWGLYSEALADEMGLYADDAERLGMYELQALRAARLVVDTGVHAFGWSREDAVATLVETGQPAWEAAAEVDRYAAMPGQALAYAIGYLEIVSLREQAQGAGRDADLAGFHDRVLALGSLPLDSVRRELDSRG